MRQSLKFRLIFFLNSYKTIYELLVVKVTVSVADFNSYSMPRHVIFLENSAHAEL